MNSESTGPHLVDIHVGGKVKLFRNMAGVTQTALADSLGLTFQQVQKYEKGTNRVSSSKLYEISRILGRDIKEFFEGIDEKTVGVDGDATGDFGNQITELMSSREGLRLNRAFVQIGDKQLRGKVIAVVESLVGIEDE